MRPSKKAKYTNKNSRYTPVWETIKANGECRITATPTLHARIIKAIIKRKDLDIAFKYKLAEASPQRRARLEYSVSGSVIHFVLKTPITYTGI